MRKIHLSRYWLWFSIVSILTSSLFASEAIATEEILDPRLTDEEKQWLQDHSEISIGVDKYWYPYEFVDERGIHAGIAADYIRFANQLLDTRFTVIQTENWNEAFELFNQGKIDLLPAIIATDERRKSITFTNPFFSTPTVIVSRKNAFYATNIDALEGKTLALVRGFAIVEYVANQYPNINIKLVDSIKEGLSQLDSGDVDAYIGAISGINSALNSGDFSQVIISAFTPFELEVSMAVNQDLKPLASILNKVFASMNNRQRAAIANTWLSIHVEQGISFQSVLLWGGPPFILLAIIVLIIFKLNNGLVKEIERRKSVEEQLKHQAQHDPLTHLPNRRLFEELAHFSLAKAKRDLEKHAILFIDIDGFKVVNDNHGHGLGDELLKAIAERLRGCIRDSDIIARHGGDEFLVLLNNNADIQFSQAVAQKVIDEIGKPFYLSERIDHIGASVGISTFPDDGDALELLIERADSAMYVAKKHGKNRFVYFKDIAIKSKRQILK